MLPDALPFGVGLRAKHGQRRWESCMFVTVGCPDETGACSGRQLIALPSVSRPLAAKSDG